MAASTRLLRIWGTPRGLSLGIPARRALWGGQRKKEVEAEAAEPDAPIEKQPVMICPPPRSRKYIPPEDLQNHLESLIRGIFESSVSGDWKKVSLGESGLKYRLLAQLAADLGHPVPNSQLHQMKSASDVLAFYSIPVKDMSKFDELSTQDLPSNLKINWQY